MSSVSPASDSAEYRRSKGVSKLPSDSHLLSSRQDLNAQAVRVAFWGDISLFYRIVFGLRFLVHRIAEVLTDVGSCSLLS